MSRWKRLGLVAAAALIVALFVYALRPQPALVDVAVVGRAPLTVAIEQQGIARVIDRYLVSAPVAGYLRRIQLRAGDLVERGQPLAWIAPSPATPLDPRARGQAEAQLGQARAAVAAAEAQRQASEAAAALAEAEYRRAQRQRQNGDISQEAFEQVRANTLQARAGLRSARFQVDVARYELAAAEAVLQAAALPAGDEVVVTAPISGRVLTVRQQSEAIVAPGQSLLELGDVGALEVAVDVLSSDAVRIRPGMSVRLQRWGGVELEGAVRTIEPAGFTKISALGVEEQRVWVIVDLLSPLPLWQRLGDAYRVEASFILWHGDDVLQVPEGALFRAGDGWAVFVVQGGRAELRQVRPGARAGLQAQILEGLQAGETVIVHPDTALAAGQRVSFRRR